MAWFKKNGLWITVHFAALIPLMWLLVDFWFDNLTVNPVQNITIRTGDTAIQLLILSLACTPLNIIFGWKQVLPLRKPLGLYAFMYASLHFLTFIGLDYGFRWGLIYEATFEKQFALVGFFALFILTLLAITSNRWAMKQVGKNWKRLHQTVYGAGLLAALHFMWARKLDLDPEALLYGGVIITLLIIRLPQIRKLFTNFRQKRKASLAATQ